MSFAPEPPLRSQKEVTLFFYFHTFNIIILEQ